MRGVDVGVQAAGKVSVLARAAWQVLDMRVQFYCVVPVYCLSCVAGAVQAFTHSP